ncbi:MAG TPA: choice-of-anchor D domain-containing protein, partial [Candidatus Kapabacteria bacterium]
AFFIMAPAVDTLFGLNMTRCDAPQTFPITISNPGCNKLNLREVTITGAPIENVSRTLTATLPIDISNNQNVIASVRVSPTTLGSFSGTIYIRYQIEGGVERDTILYYSLSVGYGTRVLAIQPENIDFGTFRLCTTLDTSVTLRNLGCDTLEITSTTITANIDALSPLYMPRTKIPPGDTTSVRVRYAPIGAGSMTGSITFSSTSDSTNPLTTNIQASIIPTDSVQIRLTPVRSLFYIGDTISMQLISDKDVSLQVGLRNMTFGMNYNGDLLTVITPIALIPGLAILPGASMRTLPAKLETQNYLLQGSPYIVLEKDKPFAEFRFVVSLTDTTTTPLFMSNIMLNNNDTVFSRCTLGIITAQTSAELTLLCGDSTLREFMRSGNVIGLRIAPSFPNPITSRTNYKATLPFTSSSKQMIRLVIVDVLGNVVKTVTAEAQSGKNTLELDASQLASGTYHFAISPLSNSSEAVVGRFVIER